MTPHTETEAAMLTAAAGGDEAAFGRLVGRYRRELYVHAYRLLASPQDAEDATQEGLLRAWQGLAGFERRSSVRSWLYTIVTNTSLRIAERRVAPEWILPLPDSELGADATVEARESVELALLAATQLLPARQRAVLVLRDVLGFSGEETAAALEMSAAGVYSALQRAKRTLEDRRPEHTQQQALHALGDEQQHALVTRYMDAWDRADVDALAALFTDDVLFSMPPDPQYFVGLANVSNFLRELPLACARWRSVPIRANGQLAFAQYEIGEDESLEPHCIAVLTLRGDRIAAVEAFRFPALVEAFV